MVDNLQELQESITQQIAQLCDGEMLFQTRIQALRNLGTHVSLKREDESGFGISGTKMRKLASLFGNYSTTRPPHFVLIGGANSNHILAMCQKINELGGDFRLFLREGAQDFVSGNALLIKMLSRSDQIHWVTRKDWLHVEQIAQRWIQDVGNESWELIPEGGYCEASVAGASSLMLDISRNEIAYFRRHKSKTNIFDHIWIDSGTGLTAACLVAMNALLGRTTRVHVVLMAGDESYFRQVYEQVRIWFRSTFSMTPPPFSGCQLHNPATGRSFGSVNATVLQASIQVAREEGILADPIYTAKLLHTAKQSIPLLPQDEHHLIVHGGGGTALLGFSEDLTKQLKKEGK